MTLFPQALAKHQVHTFEEKTIDISPPTSTKVYPRQQPSYETSSALSSNALGPTSSAPLGYIVHGRSGDKSSDCDVGLYVRNKDEWDWLRSTLTISKVKELLDGECKGGKIDRFEIPGLFAVRFLLRDHLDRGVNSSSSYDCLGKLVCEYLRRKKLDVPTVFLDRGKI